MYINAGEALADHGLGAPKDGDIYLRVGLEGRLMSTEIEQ